MPLHVLCPTFRIERSNILTMFMILLFFGYIIIFSTLQSCWILDGGWWILERIRIDGDVSIYFYSVSLSVHCLRPKSPIYNQFNFAHFLSWSRIPNAKLVPSKFPTSHNTKLIEACMHLHISQCECIIITERLCFIIIDTVNVCGYINLCLY